MLTLCAFLKIEASPDIKLISLIQEANKGGNSGHPYRGYSIVNPNAEEADDEEPDILSEVQVSSHNLKAVCAN